MDKPYLIWKNPRQAVYTVMLVLMFIGCINVFSASFVVAKDMHGNGFFYLIRYLVFGMLGLAGIKAVEYIGYKRLLNSRFLFGSYIVVLLLLFWVDIAGDTTKGAQRWIFLGPFSIQPSECAKLIVIMFTAGLLGPKMKRGEDISPYRGQGVYGMLAALLYFLMVLVQPDMGTAVIIMALTVCVYIIAGISLNIIWALLGAGGLAAIALVLTSPYRLNRVKVWLDPWIDPQNHGYQMVQSLTSIGSGGLNGIGWGLGSGKFFYIPEAHTDFAFAIFCQESGFIGGALLIILFAVLGGAFFRIVRYSKEERGFLLAAGVTLLIIGQAAANMAMVCGLLPVIGVPLIFVSYGGSSMFVSMLAIGLLLSVYDEEVKRAREERQHPEARRGTFRVIDRGGWE